METRVIVTIAVNMLALLITYLLELVSELIPRALYKYPPSLLAQLPRYLLQSLHRQLGIRLLQSCLDSLHSHTAPRHRDTFAQAQRTGRQHVRRAHHDGVQHLQVMRLFALWLELQLVAQIIQITLLIVLIYQC